MITPIPKETEAPAIVAMRELVDSLEPALTDLASLHARQFGQLWRNPDFTPAEALAALGDRAAAVMAVASANVQLIAAVAPMFGKTLANFLAAEDYTPPQEFTVHDDGTVTLD